MDVVRIALAMDQFCICDRADWEAVLITADKLGRTFCLKPANCRWRAVRSKSGFYCLTSVRHGGKAVHVRMHRLVMGASQYEFVDHRDGDGLNNSRSNLRICTASQNSQNRRPIQSSRFKGAFLHKQSGKYCASIKLDGKPIHLGLFPSVEEAARAYDTAAIELFGDFARLNFPTHTASCG